MRSGTRKLMAPPILSLLLALLCLQCGDDKSVDDNKVTISLNQVGTLSGLQAMDVEVAGNYAYIADEAQVLVVVDITERPTPAIVGSVGRTGTENGVALTVAGQYAYVAVEGDGMYIIDISQPATPTTVGMFSGAYAKDVAVVGNYAYIADQDFGLRVVDISNPASPVLTGSCQTAGPFGIAVSGSYAYCADNDSALCVVDISNPASPVIVGRYLDLESARTIDVQPGKVFLDDDGTGPVILNVSAPAAPALISRYQGNCSHLKAVGNYLYVTYISAGYTGGLAVINISDAANPVLADSLSVTPITEGLDVDDKHVYVAANDRFLIFSK